MKRWSFARPNSVSGLLPALLNERPPPPPSKPSVSVPSGTALTESAARMQQTIETQVT